MLSVEIQSLIDMIEQDGLAATLDSDVDWTPIEDVDPALYETLRAAQHDVGVLMNTLETLSKEP